MVKYFVRNYTINDDLTVHVNGSVNLTNQKTEKIEVQFRVVTGDFSCDGNILTNLEGCPKEVGGTFSCSMNYLKTLKNCPKKVGGNFDCSDNKLNNLDFLPKEIGSGFFDCSFNKELGELQSIKNIKKIKTTLSKYKLEEDLKIKDSNKTNKKVKI